MKMFRAMRVKRAEKDISSMLFSLIQNEEEEEEQLSAGQSLFLKNGGGIPGQ